MTALQRASTTSANPPPEATVGVDPAGEAQASGAILRDRARRLAMVLEADGGGATIEVLECRLGDSQYGLDMQLLRGVKGAARLTPVPCAPAFVAGLLNVRGEVVAVLDLAAALGLAAAATTRVDRPTVVLVDMPGVRVGLLVDQVLGARPVAVAALERAPSGADAARGVIDGTTVLLDLERLFAGGRFDVADEVATL